MNNSLSILLVEDDSNACETIVNIVENSEDLALTGVTNNSIRATELITDTLPDAVILDLELHVGNGSGLDVLKALSEMNLSKIPYILITTNNSSPVTYEAARQMGADFIMYKHEQDYSEQKVLDFLRLIAPVIRAGSNKGAKLNSTPETPEQQIKRITKRIITELNLICINPKAVGYKYLVDAINMVIRDDTQNICCKIGNKYGKTESSVERAMQNAINRAWQSAPLDDLLTNYTAHINSNKGIPTITEFIFYYANKIKSDY